MRKRRARQSTHHEDVAFLGKGYPGALAELLAARSPGYHVVNLGVSGSNTAQFRLRFPAWHPTQVRYDEVGAMVLEVLDEHGWLANTSR